MLDRERRTLTRQGVPVPVGHRGYVLLETLLDASAGIAETDPKALAAELQTLAAELEELTQAVERSSPAQVEPGEYRTAVA